MIIQNFILKNSFETLYIYVHALMRIEILIICIKMLLKNEYSTPKNIYECSSQQKLAHLRKEEAQRDLVNLDDQLKRKKSKLEEMEDLMKRRVRELQDLQTLGLTKADVLLFLLSTNT